MYVSKEVDYGLRLMIALAAQGGKALSDHEISKTFKIPFNFLALLLPKLMRAGLVSLQKDEKKHDVYRIGKKPTDITILEITNAVNGPVDLIALNKVDRGEVEPFGAMMVMWDGLTLEVEKYLRNMTLDQCPLVQKS